LLSAAYRDIQENPNGSPSHRVIETAAGFALYPLKYSLRRLPAGDRVRRPRHLVAFWFDDLEVVILDILHDRMDLPTRLAALVADRGLPPAP
jgi:plasmid stabilization system protein ParE